ncbi:MAG: di-trans,poly-cis-decaprenylcistransferase [Flavobacteriales bacterium]|jgi:undecaprenyl diphosphate synthase|nr:di-trans,poly-cis-decaprenylcistransferase [Flavobacteriales bacterium]
MDINKKKIPTHVAIIMDGNGRWAKERGLERVYGHANGVASVRKAIKASLDMGVKVLTLYAFSQENWNRPAAEVEALMLLMVSNMKQELPSFIEQGVRFRYIGNRAALSDEVREEFDYCERQTAHCERLTLVIAVSYSAREELAMAAQKIARRAVEGEIRVEDIDVEMMEENLYAGDLPAVDLMIRTSGEIRISNFLLWQVAYAEFYFTDLYWPDFDEKEYEKAVEYYGSRERRFGKTSEQIKLENSINQE